MSAKLICRICGREYDGCRSKSMPNGAFRWQEVACSPEHGAEYLELVIAARNPQPVKEKKAELIEIKPVFDFNEPILEEDAFDEEELEQEV